MMRMRAVAIVTLLSVQCFAASITHPALLELVVDALENSLKFFTEDYSSINVDGLFGLRLGQGQLLSAIRECELKSCDETILDKLRSLERELNTACDAAMPYVKDDDEVYYDRFIDSIEKPYILSYVPTEFDHQRGDIRKIGPYRIYNENRGDDCYTRMMGTYEENGKMVPKCNMTEDCWDYMTKKGTSGYFVTHQLLYFIMAEHVGCRESVESFINGTTVFEEYKRMCNDIYNEARSFARRGDVILRHKDLFLEQTLLCAPLGFEDFLRPDWIRMVLGWPNKHLGCFRQEMSEFDLKMTLNGLVDTQGLKAEELAMMKENGITMPTLNPTMRKLLREKAMKDGCLSHTSGLGFGVFNTYLRFLLRYL